MQQNTFLTFSFFAKPVRLSVKCILVKISVFVVERVEAVC